MTVIERRIELLQKSTRRLVRLLDDPHPGLSTWMEAVPRVVKEINAIMDGKRD